MTTRPLIWVPGIFSILFAQAQINSGGIPTSFQAPELSVTRIPEMEFHRISLTAAEPRTDEHGVAKYGEQLFQAIDLVAQGHWDLHEDGSAVCRLTLRSPGAAMISVQFDVRSVRPPCQLRPP